MEEWKEERKIGREGGRKERMEGGKRKGRQEEKNE